MFPMFNQNLVQNVSFFWNGWSLCPKKKVILENLRHINKNLK
jgi:hypothetical protein